MNESSSTATLDSIPATQQQQQPPPSHQNSTSDLSPEGNSLSASYNNEQQHKNQEKTGKGQNDHGNNDTKSSSKPIRRKASVAGDYAVYIEDEIGRGSFSKVFPATLLASPAPRGREEFAAKYCELTNSDARNRFDEEANNVVRIHDKFQTPYVVKLVKRFLARPSDESTPQKGILIYEMCRGPSLHSILFNGPLPLHLTHRFVAQMVEALACCHARGCEVVHRDVKPENFLLSSRDLETASICLIDFGFSVRSEAREPSGTPMFMSPEVIGGNLHGAPTDIFSLGVTILCMIFGLQHSEHFGVLLRMPQPPRGAGSISVKFVRDNIDESSPYFPLRYIVEACLETDPRKRPTAMQLRGDPWIRSAGIATAKKYGHSSLPSGQVPSASAVFVPHKQDGPPTASDEQLLVVAANKNSSASSAEASAATTVESNTKTDDIKKPSTPANPSSSSSTKPNSNTAVNEGQQQEQQQQQQQQQSTAFNNLHDTFVQQVEQTPAERVKGSFVLQIDGFGDRIQALLAIANSLQVPARRATICAKVARILCHEVAKQKGTSTSSSDKEIAEAATRVGLKNISFLSDAYNNNALVHNSSDDSNNNNNNNNSGATNGSHHHQQQQQQQHGSTNSLLEQLQWVKSQLASMMNVLPDDEPLPDCDAAIADGVQNLASAALRAMLLGERECCYGECVLIIRFCRIALTKDLAHYSELNSLRKKLDAFALVA